MMHKAWSSIKEAPYCFPRSYVKWQVHMAKNIIEFDPDWEFPDCNSSFNSLMELKWYTKLDQMWYRRNALLFFGVIHQISRTHRRKTGDFNPIWVRLLGRSQLSNPSDLPWGFFYLFFLSHTQEVWIDPMYIAWKYHNYSLEYFEQCIFTRG